MKLRATSLLGDNTTLMLTDLCGLLGEAGLALDFDADLKLSARRAQVEAGEIDLVWACGLLTAEMIDAGVGLDVVAAPVFAGEGQAVYRSVILGHPDRAYESLADALSGRLAVNEYGSWSGWHAYVDHLRHAGLDATDHPVTVLTGSHRNSAHALLDGVVDVAAIDSALWSFLVDENSGLGYLKGLGTTRDWPAPPVSIRAGLDDDVSTALRTALLAASDSSTPTFHPATAAEYESMLRMSRVA